jgi:hypothetical protein
MQRNELGRKYYSLDLDTVVLFKTNRPLDNRRYFYPVPIALSQGLFMIFTIPLNSIYAIISSGREMQELSFLNYPFGELHDFARYPQGLPEGFSAAVYSPPARY